VPPRSSLFIPIRNDGRWLPGASKRVRARTYADWEAVIGDSASTDDLASVVARHSDPRIRYHRWPTHVGVYEDHNRTMLLCRFESVPTRIPCWEVTPPGRG
jgi:glycosyltransferase involved in cell wall biosynthesis